MALGREDPILVEESMGTGPTVSTEQSTMLSLANEEPPELGWSSPTRMFAILLVQGKKEKRHKPDCSPRSWTVHPHHMFLSDAEKRTSGLCDSHVRRTSQLFAVKYLWIETPLFLVNLTSAEEIQIPCTTWSSIWAP